MKVQKVNDLMVFHRMKNVFTVHLTFATNLLIEFSPYGASVHNAIWQYPSNSFLHFYGLIFITWNIL